MGLFDRFKKKEDSVLPSDVDDYYKSELKTRRGSSVLMALLALVLTLVIAAGLFFGTRAIYRTFNKSDSPKPTSQETGNQENQGTVEQATPDTDTKPSGSGSPNSSDGEDSGSSSSSGQPSTGTGSNQSPNANPTTGDIPATGDSPALPTTGDEGQ